MPTKLTRQKFATYPVNYREVTMPRKQNLNLLILIIIAGIVIRLVNFSFPSFTADEARTAYRGYTISHFGKDELGRSWPLLFNSLTDYQLPVVPYTAALGEAIFGKTDLGVRIPFIVIGVAILILTYKIARLLFQKEKFWLMSVLVLAFSPALIFLSKIPNDSIVLTFFILLLVHLLLKDKLNLVVIFFALILSILVSKFAWFIIPLLVTFTLFFYRDDLPNKIKFKLSLLSLFLVLIIIGLYLQVPQSKRSLTENNFSILTSETIKNGIDKSRGEGIRSGWPNKVEAIFFNKTYFPVIGFIHWLSNLQPAVYFGQLDATGRLNFSQSGAFSRVLIIPFIWGLVYLARQGRKKEKSLIGFLFILTFPAIFIYPNFSQNLVLLTLPFVAFVIAFGLVQFNRIFSLLIISLAVLELILNLVYLSPEQKNTNLLRPEWMKALTKDVYSQSINHKTALSDNIAEDTMVFIEWYNQVDVRTAYLDIPYPYKFHQTSIKNLKIIGFDNQLHSCEVEDYERVFASRRDREKTEGSNIGVIKTYRDSLGQEVVYLLDRGLCIK